jgi:hypothetical protein
MLLDALPEKPEMLTPVTLTVPLYQSRNTLISSTTAPPMEIQAPREMFDASNPADRAGD